MPAARATGLDAENWPTWVIAGAGERLVEWNAAAARWCNWRRRRPHRPLADLERRLRIAFALGRAFPSLRDLVRSTPATAVVPAWFADPLGTTRPVALTIVPEPAERVLAVAVPAGRSATRIAERIAHDLNNSTAALQGFAELAQESAGARSHAGRLLAEISDGLRPLTALAADLETLADDCCGAPSPTPLHRCLPEGALAALEPGAVGVDAEVRVDAEQSRRAIDALLRLAAEPGARGTPRVVARRATRPVRCAVCGFDSAAPCVIVQSVAARGLADAALLREPLEARGHWRARATTCAALVAASHRAGAHVVADPEAGTLGVALNAVQATRDRRKP